MERYQSYRNWQAAQKAADAALEEVSALIQSGSEPNREHLDTVMHLRSAAKKKLRIMVEEVQAWTPVADDPL